MVSRFGVAALTKLIKSLGGKAVTRRNISFLGPGKGPKQSLYLSSFLILKLNSFHLIL